MTKKELTERIKTWKPGAEIKVLVEEHPARPGGRWEILAASEEACFPAQREGYKWSFSNILCRSLTRGGAETRAAKIGRWIKQMYAGPGIGSYGPPRDFAAESERMFAERTDGKVRSMLMPPRMRLPLDSPEHSKLFELVKDKPELWTETVLYKVGRNSVPVNYFLNLQARGDLSHEQALMGSVLYLWEENRRLMNQAKDFYWTFPGPMPLPQVDKPAAEDAENEKEKGQ